ncbi:hypothetical protein [Neobacillus sp. DY30]|uniref:hypothetical protein n=1 Tax=Neobacillus sp. DY30 TaxID=3047871 RepID=UPI0024C0859C|nr:hypothetical protein [Neobacillus sp. DY30]WHY02624.1 hypothetical protein QNH29_10540 [Neobacillus sp. DY30]
MLRNVIRRFILFLIGSSIFAAFIGYALHKAGLISFQGNSQSQRALNIKERNRTRRVGRIRVTT